MTHKTLSQQKQNTEIHTSANNMWAANKQVVPNHMGSNSYINQSQADTLLRQPSLVTAARADKFGLSFWGPEIPACLHTTACRGEEEGERESTKQSREDEGHGEKQFGRVYTGRISQKKVERKEKKKRLWEKKHMGEQWFCLRSLCSIGARLHMKQWDIEIWTIINHIHFSWAQRGHKRRRRAEVNRKSTYHKHDSIWKQRFSNYYTAVLTLLSVQMIKTTNSKLSS